MKTRWISERFARFACAAGMTLLAGIGSVSAQIFWQGGDGDFHTPTNWVGHEVPGIEDHAAFNTKETHAVWMSAGATNDQFTVGRNSDGDGTAVVLNLNEQTYRLTSDRTGTGAALLVGDFATGMLTVSNGTLITGGFILGRSPSGLTGRGTMIVTGSNTVWQSGNADGRVGREGSDALLRIEDGATATLGLLNIGDQFTGPTSAVLHVTGQGTLLNLKGTMSWGDRAPATVRIEEQGLYLAELTGDASIQSNADVTIDNARAIFEGSGANRQVNIRGLVTVENGGTLTATNQMSRIRVRSGGVLVVGVEGGVRATQIYVEDEGSTLRAVLHTGATNALVIAPSNVNQLHNTALFEVELAPGFESELEETFTIIASGGWHASHREFFSNLPEGGTITAFESASGKTYEFLASYQNNHFTLTTIPEPGSLVLLGLAGIGLWAARRRRMVP